MFLSRTGSIYPLFIPKTSELITFALSEFIMQMEKEVTLILLLGLPL
jgi:hypothetical protein